jgi:hypothetical protein
MLVVGCRATLLVKSFQDRPDLLCVAPDLCRTVVYQLSSFLDQQLRKIVAAVLSEALICAGHETLHANR